VRLVTLDARNAGELDAALRAIPRSAADGVLVAGDFLFVTNVAKIARTVRKTKLPAMAPWMHNPDDGLLMSYGVNLKELGRHAAIFVDKILKGSKPADLPIEQINKYELVIDLRVANEQGIKVPQELP
jgi:putative ABC transport system substrate-binding protein